MSPDLSFEIKRKHCSNGAFVAKDFVLNQLGAYHERVYADNIASNFWFVRCFSSQHYYKFITNITSGNVSQTRTKEWKTRCFICQVNLNFLRSSRHLNFDTDKIVSFWNETVDAFNIIGNGRVETKFQLIEF